MLKTFQNICAFHSNVRKFSGLFVKHFEQYAKIMHFSILFRNSLQNLKRFFSTSNEAGPLNYCSIEWQSCRRHCLSIINIILLSVLFWALKIFGELFAIEKFLVSFRRAGFIAQHMAEESNQFKYWHRILDLNPIGLPIFELSLEVVRQNLSLVERVFLNSLGFWLTM